MHAIYHVTYTHTNTNTTHTRMTHARTHKLKQWERRMGRVKGGRGEEERGLADLQRRRQQNPRVDSDTCVDTHKCTTAEQRGNEMEEGGDWGCEGEGGEEGKERREKEVWKIASCLLSIVTVMPRDLERVNDSASLQPFRFKSTFFRLCTSYCWRNMVFRRRV